MEKIRIYRIAKTGVYPFSRVFRGFENAGAVQRIFGRDTKKVLDRLQVGVRHSRRGSYMWTEIEKMRRLSGHSPHPAGLRPDRRQTGARSGADTGSGS